MYPRGVLVSLPEPDKKKLLARLRRAQGQLAGIGRMIDEGKPCVDTLTQISAIQGALGKVGELILAEHIESCVADAFKHGDEDQRQEAIDDLMDVFSRYGRRGSR
jgi:DNA-binding FrmR family transcriptional regulator